MNRNAQADNLQIETDYKQKKIGWSSSIRGNMTATNHKTRSDFIQTGCGDTDVGIFLKQKGHEKYINSKECSARMRQFPINLPTSHPTRPFVFVILRTAA